jgi:predicted Zn finger-like uncharacterized protein
MSPMLTVCPNCATSYGVEMASLRLPSGWARQVRCNRCRCVWEAELSVADRLVIAANAVAPVRRAMAAVQAVLDGAAWSPRPVRMTAPPADAFAAAPAQPSGVDLPRLHATTDATTAADFFSAICAVVASWRTRLTRLRWRLSLSSAHIIIVVLILVDAAIIGCRAELIWAMPQTASFYATVGLPADANGLRFENVTATAERRDANPVLVVEGKVSNGANKIEAIPHLRFALRNASQQEIYSWSAAPERGGLAPGDAIRFRSELALPPSDTRDVVVSFVDRADKL